MQTGPSKHTWYEDIFGILTGSILLGVGISILHAGDILTGGTVGLALLLCQYFNISLSVMYILISIPFFAIGIWKKGLVFSLRSLVNILLVSYIVDLIPRYIEIKISNDLFASIAANTVLGIGLLAIFRHNSSLGGFGVVALIFQEKLKIQAGYVQATLDLIVLLVGLNVYSFSAIASSLVGVVILNGILVLNHREDRYVGSSK
jgi:uncharacterized membrane-anchored protein YitT (DUF2179 family)